ncbi:hypothetical protein ACFFWA_27515 [Actinomadura verrucosospora]|uniref:hypothetical protein n=1 Tax=Actinomadura verrucosospora TaxID=46165 RepID=UPI0031EF04F4
MAGGAVRVGAVSALLRRAAVGRSVRRLLVLGGLLIAGWLLGCAAQVAHADEPPTAPVTGVVEKTPLLGDAVQTVRDRRPVREAPGVAAPVEVVGVVAPQPPDEKTAHDVPPPPPEVRVEPSVKRKPRPVVTEVAAAPETHREASAPAVSSLSRTRPGVGHAARHVVVRHHPAPSPAPEKPGTHSATGGFIASSVAAGFPSAGTPVPAPRRASLRPVFGAVPPAVRTAADEPSFAPD